MTQFAYIGARDETTVFGLSFPRGVAVEVSDSHAIAKLSNNANFSAVVDGVEVMQAEPKRRGRPPKAQ